MQLKISYQGQEVKCEDGQNCEAQFCRRELLMKVLMSFVRPQLAPIINRIFEVQELFSLADVISQGENQLHHVIKLCENADSIDEHALKELGISRDLLITAALFHDIGKGKEIDDCFFEPDKISISKVPQMLRKYNLPSWIEYKLPIHQHIEKGIEIAQSYNLKNEIIESIALHHHIKIQREVLDTVGKSLKLAPMIMEDILNYQPEQYAAKGSKLAQVVAILDQLNAIERKLGTSLSAGLEPGKLEDELVKDLVIGVALTDDSRFHILGFSIEGNETVILLDLSSFGTFVQLHSEYEVQALKKTVLNIIRSAVRGQDGHRDKDLVGLVGGDEYVIITKVRDVDILNTIITRVSNAVRAKTSFNLRVGYGMDGAIPANFHEARTVCNLKKKHKFV